MSYAIDVNVVLYASDTRSARYEGAKRFLQEASSRKDLLCIPWPVAMSYVRSATHPRIFNDPLSTTEALQNLEALAALPQVRFLSERENFLEEFRTLAASLNARGNLIPDVHIATILRQHGVRLFYTSDRDFRRFDFLDVRDPFTE